MDALREAQPEFWESPDVWGCREKHGEEVKKINEVFQKETVPQVGNLRR